MMLVRFITVNKRTRDDDVCAWRFLNVLSLLLGVVATVFMSFVANFPEGQSHGVGHVHFVGAGCVFTGGCLFIVMDTVITLRTRWLSHQQQQLQQNWCRHLRWFEWPRPIIAVLSIVTGLLCILFQYTYSVEINMISVGAILDRTTFPPKITFLYKSTPTSADLGRIAWLQHVKDQTKFVTIFLSAPTT